MAANEPGSFVQTAKGLARNPLGIVALFIVLVYAFASLVVTFSEKLLSRQIEIIVWFLVLFPVVVLGVFAWLVSQHHEKLYAPKDFGSDDAFLRGVPNRTGQMMQLERQIEERVKETLTSDKLVHDLNASSGNVVDTLRRAAEDVAKEIRDVSSLVVDARAFTRNAQAVYYYPVAAFATFQELLDQIYLILSTQVAPYEYGYSWALKRKADGGIIKSARQITRTRRGRPVKDLRALSEVGIKGGTELEVVEGAER